MAYAVVIFNDNDVSEVPSNWLEVNDDESSCWWPANCRNVSTLIAKRSEPDKKSWDYLPVTVETFYKSLEKARKIAEDASYVTTDDDQLGKGRRKVIAKRRMSSFSSEDAENENQSKTLKPIKARELHRNILSDLPPIPNSSSEISGSLRFQYSHDVVEATGLKQITKFHDVIRGARPKETEAFGKNNTVLSNENNGTSGQDQCDMDEEAENVDDPYMTIPTPVAMPATLKKENFSEISTLARKAFDGMEPMDRNPEEYSRIIIRMLASIQVQLRELHLKIECGKPMPSGNIGLVTPLLPLKSIAEIEAFEKKIHENPEVKEQFNTFVRKIGGHTVREDIQRTCTKVFTNPCAELCSWKGRKENFCIEGLCIIKIMQDAILNTYPATREIEFEETVAEWFRFAKQRRTRTAEKEKKKQREESEDDGGKTDSFKVTESSLDKR